MYNILLINLTNLFRGVAQGGKAANALSKQKYSSGSAASSSDGDLSSDDLSSSGDVSPSAESFNSFNLFWNVFTSVLIGWFVAWVISKILKSFDKTEKYSKRAFWISLPVVAIIYFFASGGASIKTHKNAAHDKTKEIIGSWSHEGTGDSFDQEIIETGMTNYYDDGTFKNEYTKKDMNGKTLLSVSVVGNYKVENNQIKYDIDRENYNLKLDSALAKEYDVDIMKYASWVNYCIEPEQIVSLNPKTLKKKFYNGVTNTYNRITTSGKNPDSAALKALTTKKQSGKYSVKDVVGTWSHDNKPYDDAEGIESFTFYDDDSFSFSTVWKDEDDELIRSMDVHGRYKVVNDKIEYLVKYDNVSVKYGKIYSDWLQEEAGFPPEEDMKYGVWSVFFEGDKIVSLTPTKMEIKDSDGKIYEYYKQK